MKKSKLALSLLLKIPKGRVTTYGELARATGSSPRAIGQILKSNKEPKKYPCYKVVKSNGEIGGYSGNKNKINQKIRLIEKDGIKVENCRINLRKYIHKFRSL